MEVASTGSSDLIAVNGTATLQGGLVIVSTIDGTYNFNDVYTIITASNISGTYLTAIAGQPLVKPVLTYDKEHVYLQITTAIDRAAKTCNEHAVARQLDGISHPNAEQTLLQNEFVGLSISNASTALNTLTGEQYTNDLLATETLNRQFIRRLYDPIRPLITTEPCPCTCTQNLFSTWLETGGGHSYFNGNKNASGFHSDGYEITAGLQGTFCNMWSVGAAGSYECDWLHYNLSGKGKSNTWLVGLYGLYRPSCYYGLVDFAYGYSTNSLKRSIDIGELHYRTHSSPKITQFTFYGEIGVDYTLNCVLIQPFAGIEAGAFHRNRIIEHNAGGWELNIKQRRRTNVFGRIGLHLTANTFSEYCALRLDLAWAKRLTSRSNKIHASFAQFGSDFEIDGIPLGNSCIECAVTASVKLWENMSVYAEGNAEAWNHASTYGFLGGLQWHW